MEIDGLRKSLLIEIDQHREDLRIALRQLVEDAELHARWCAIPEDLPFYAGTASGDPQRAFAEQNERNLADVKRIERYLRQATRRLTNHVFETHNAQND